MAKAKKKGRIRAQDVASDLGVTTTTVYRRINQDPEKKAAAEVMRSLDKRLRAAPQRTRDSYEGMLRFLGASDSEIELHRKTHPKVLQGLRAKVATAARKRKADERSKKAVDLESQGFSQKAIAKEIGIKTARGVRKSLKRGKRNY